MKYLILFLLILSFPMLAQSDFDLGEVYFKSEKYHLAKPLFEMYNKQNPNDLKTLEYLGDIQCYYKNWNNASVFYNKLKLLKTSEADYFYKYGGALGMYAKECNKFKALLILDDVKAAFEKAIILNPSHIGARWALLEIYIQLPSIVGGSEKKAVKYSDELLKISPVDGYLSKGHIEEYFKRYKKAENYYLKAIEIGNSRITHQKLADLYKKKMNQPEKAKLIINSYNEKNKL